VFFSARHPASRGRACPDANPDVVGVDIRLDAISRFWVAVDWKDGRAYIVRRRGDDRRSDPERILLTRDGQLTPAKSTRSGTRTLSRVGIISEPRTGDR